MRSSSIPPGTRCCASRSRTARGAVHARLADRGGPRLSRLDDARRGACLAGFGARSGCSVGAAAHGFRLLPLRDGDDRAAGRLRRPREPDRRDAARRRRVRVAWLEVVLLGAAVAHLPRPRAGARRLVVLPPRAWPRLRDPAAQGQARRSLERVERDRAARRAGAARGGGGARRADDRRDGRPHAARLRPRHRGRDAPGGRAVEDQLATSLQVRPSYSYSACAKARSSES